MDSLHEEGSRSIVDYTGWIQRRWWAIVAVVVLGLVATGVVTARQQRVYDASSAVLVQATGTSTDQTQTGARNISGLNLDTEAQLVTSLVVAERAKEQLGSGTSATELARRVSVTVPANTQVLEIAFAAPTPSEARAGSAAFAQAYLDQRRANAQDEITVQVTALEKQQAAQLKALQDLSGQIAQLAPNSVNRNRAESQLAVVQNSLTQIGSRLSPLQAAEPTPGSIITKAELPTAPTEPKLVLNLGTGLAASVLAGLLLALLVDRADTRLRRAAEVTTRTGMPVLLDFRRGGPPDVASYQSAAGRDFGRLRNTLASALAGDGGATDAQARIVVMSGASAGQAAGLVTANLAASLDRFGVPVLVICADPRSWTLDALGVQPGPGLVEVLRGELSLDAAVTEVADRSRLVVLGPGGADATGVLTQEMREDRVRGLVAELRGRSGYVLFEAPPPDVAIDGQVMAGYADAVLVVVETKRTRTQELAEAFRRFEEVRARLVGAVVVGFLGKAPRAGTDRTRAAGPPVAAEPAPRAAEPGPVAAPPRPVGTEPATGRADVVRASAAPDARDTPVHPLQDDDTVTFVFTHGDAESPGPAQPEGQGDTDLASGSRGTRSR
jgi:capsular polysaccharide biosynthesis protein